MFRNFKSDATRDIMAKMLGTLTPAEISEVIEDQEVAKTDIPKWVELVVQEKCTIIMKRLELYEQQFLDRYGVVQHTIQKLSVYHKIWTNWDGCEPCQFDDNMPLYYFFDTNVRETTDACITNPTS